MSYQYHLTLVSVKMHIKFPCRMKIEHEGSIVTGEVAPTPDHRYIFNQEVLLRQSNGQESFEMTVHIVTDKGAKYIAGQVRVYQAQLLRSEGERLVLSLAKCMDPEAYCQARVDQIVTLGEAGPAPAVDRMSRIQRETPFRAREATQFDESPPKHQPRAIESKSEYQYPLRKASNTAVNWETKSRSRYVPAQSAYHPQPARPVSRPANYAVGQGAQSQEGGYYYGAEGPTAGFNTEREKLMEAQVYKEGYQKLKEKYKKEAQLNKQEINKRLALQNNENALKLQIMRYKMRLEQTDKHLSDKNGKVKQLQGQLIALQQLQTQNKYLKEDIAKKEEIVRSYEEQLRSAGVKMDEIRDSANQQLNMESGHVRELNLEIEGLKVKLEGRERELEREEKSRVELLHQKELELVSTKETLERQRKNLTQAHRANQAKLSDLDRSMAQQRQQLRSQLQDSKRRWQKLQKDIMRMDQQRRQMQREWEQSKNSQLKSEYEKRVALQEIDSIKGEYQQLKKYKEKYSEVVREKRELLETRGELERQIEKIMQSKESSLSDMGKQFQEQMEYYRRVNRELDDKVKHMGNKQVETEGQLELVRGQADKVRRSYETAIKEAADATEKEKQARRAIRAREQETLTMESQYATMKQKLKSLEQICKLEVDKVREEMEKVTFQYENELEKNQQLSEANNQMSMDLNRLNIKIQYADEKGQKDSQVIKEKQQQIESLISDYDSQIENLERTINTLRMSEKELSTKNQKNEYDIIKNDQRLEKARRDIKALEERCAGLDTSLKTKEMEWQVASKEKDDVAMRLAENEGQFGELRKDYAMLQNERNKMEKMNDMLSADLNATKKEVGSGLRSVAEKEKIEEDLRNEIKRCNEATAELDTRLATFKKETEKHKESLFDGIYRYLLPLLHSSSQPALPPKPSDSSFSDALTTIITHSKDLKQTLTRHTQQIKQLTREKERLQDEVATSNNKAHNSELTLQTQIGDLEAEIQEVIEEKENEANAFTDIIADLNERLHAFEQLQEQLNAQIEELNFNLNNVRMEAEAMGNDQAKKIANLKKLNQDQEDKIEEQIQLITDIDEKCTNLELDLDNLQLTAETLRDTLNKREKELTELRQIKDSQEEAIIELKRSRKELTERVADLELHLGTEQEINIKTKKLLEQQQKKGMELKDFIGALMKQKQTAIKNDLDKSEQIISLETQLMETTKELELARGDSEKYSGTVESQREAARKNGLALKELENERNDLADKSKKLQQRLRQKERQLVEWEQSVRRLQQKYDKTVEKHRGQMNDLQYEVDLINNSSLEMTKESNEKMIQLENQLHEKRSVISALENKITEFEEQLYAEMEKVMSLEGNLVSAKAEIEELRGNLKEMEASLTTASDENRQKEESMFEMGGKLYRLEMQIEAKENDFTRRMEEMSLEYGDKYEAVVEEYEQRMEITEKERDYFRKQLEDKDLEASRLNQTIRGLEATESNNRSSFEERMKRLQEDKLVLVTSKNNELQRMGEELKHHSEMVKSRQAELRRVSHELQIARKSILTVEDRVRESEEKVKGTTRTYQAELEQLKKKEVAGRNYRQAVSNHLWTLEREVKKGVQAFIKNFLQVSEDRNSQRILELIRAHEKNVVGILATRPAQK